VASITAGPVRLAADLSNPTVRDRYVASESRPADPIDDSAAANDDVVHGRHSCDWRSNDHAPLLPVAQRQLAVRSPERQADRHLAEDRWSSYHPCFPTRLGGVSGGKDSQGWRDSSHTAMVGGRKIGSAKLPMATAMYPETFVLPVDGGAACRTEMKGQRVAAFGCPHPCRSLTGEGDLLAAEARLVADHGPGTALALQAVAHGDARWFPSIVR